MEALRNGLISLILFATIPLGFSKTIDRSDVLTPNSLDKFHSLQVLNLDQIIERILINRTHSPLLKGQDHVIQHPEFQHLTLLAYQLDTRIEWTDCVSTFDYVFCKGA